MSEDLSRFVHEALAKGRPREEIRAVLGEARWPADAIDKALAAYADVEYPVPVPRPKPYVSAREAFVYLVVFSALYACAFSLGSLVFLLIEHAVPDPAAGDRFSFLVEGVRWSASWLLITFPVYLWLSRVTYVATRRDPEKRYSKIRRWLTYLTLFVALAVLVGDLVTVVFNLLAGELTVRFLLKVLTVGAIAGAVFGYYTWDLRRDDVPREVGHGVHPGLRAFVGVVSVAVVAALAAGLWLAGNPVRARAQRLDDRREAHLEAIAGAIDTYWERHESLPPSLEELARERGVRVQSVEDPVTGVGYEYRPMEGRRYELCAVFDAEDRGAKETRGRIARGTRFWEHGAGRTCFEIEALDRTKDD